AAQLTHVRIADCRLDGVHMFDGGFPTSAGVSGRLGPLGSDAEIGLADTLPYKLAETSETDILLAARRSQHKAVLLITGGSRPGLFLMKGILGLVALVAHMSGAGLVGRRIAHTSGVFFWVWRLIMLGVSSALSGILSARGLWSGQWGQSR